MFLNYFFQDIPDLVFDFFNHALGVLDIVGDAIMDQPAHDKGLEQLQGHLLGQTALIHPEFRSHHDDGTAGVVHPLAQEVLAESALLALEQVAEGFQGPISRSCDRPPPPPVVDEGVDGLLKHALFVAHDDVGSAQIQEALEPIVAVDDPAVQVVEIGGGKAPAL